ncbi:MAG: helix-turn-helix transcriptional regulator [Henriciella sp.]|nr:LuxR C-terminal-related transcriptional regulator [Hyphomonadaceae bacterium]
MTPLILELETMPSFKALSRRCYSYFLDKGVCQFSYFHFPPIGAADYDRVKIIVWLGYPQAWVETYQRLGYVDEDPIVKRLERSHRPFWVHAVAKEDQATQDEADYVTHLIDCGVHEDLAVPVFGPSGRNGGYGIGFLPDATRPSQLETREIQWVCQTAHIRYCELLEQRSENTPKLSLRETEVLQQIAQGKSNRQIAERLSVSSKTVETYLARIFDKMDVHDRMTAALRAIATGVIT